MAPDESPQARPGHRMPELVEVMARLLGPGGCPWDREQTLASLIPFLLEESYEVIEAIEVKGPEEHCEELGDVLLQVVFQAALQSAAGEFDIDAVIAGIIDKLVRRHPHVFGDADAETSGEGLAQWNAIKAEEKRAKAAAKGEPDAPPARLLDAVSEHLPALPQAHQISRKVAKVGFDWEDAAGCADKVREELAEIDEAARAGDRAELEAEVGDLLFAAVSLARKLGCDPETALRHANRRFRARFGYVEDRLREAGRSPSESNLAEMDTLWEQAKLTP